MPSLPEPGSGAVRRPPDLRAVVLGLSAWAGGLVAFGLPGWAGSALGAVALVAVLLAR